MKSKDSPLDLDVEYQRLLRLLASNLKYVEGVGADPKLTESYRRLLRYLRSRPPSTALEILGNATSRKTGAKSGKVIPALSDAEILQMTPDEIIRFGSRPDTPRVHLERIAVLRFGMTRGGISNLRSRDALVEKLITLIRNEGAHDAIARVAVKQRSE
jgi:hypothetical protein